MTDLLASYEYKLKECADLRDEIKELDEQISELQQRVKRHEDEYRDTFHPIVEFIVEHDISIQLGDDANVVSAFLTYAQGMHEAIIFIEETMIATLTENEQLKDKVQKLESVIIGEDDDPTEWDTEIPEPSAESEIIDRVRNITGSHKFREMSYCYSEQDVTISFSEVKPPSGNQWFVYIDGPKVNGQTNTGAYKSRDAAIKTFAKLVRQQLAQPI